MTATPDILMYGQRLELPNRRRGYNQKITILDGQRRIVLHLRTSEYSDGSLGEVFCSVADIYKSMDSAVPSSLGAMVDAWCIAVSLALQHGCPLESLVQLYTFTRYAPSGIVRDHEHLRMCTSIADVIMRDLAIRYLGRMDLAQVK